MRHAMNQSEFLTLTVSLEDREDGGVRVSSTELPGLVLSGADKQSVVEAIAPAIKALLEHGGLTIFEVHHSKPVAEILDGKNPQDVDMHVQHFVVEIRQAA